MKSGKRLWFWIGVVLVGVIIPSTGNAQLSIGATSGFNVASFRWPNSIRNSPQSEPLVRGGLMGGIILEYELSSTLALHSEVLFHQKGGKLRSRVPTSEGSEEVFETIISLNYLEIPLMVRAYSKASSLRFFGGAGIAVAAGLSGRDELTITTFKPGTGPVTDSAFRDIDFKSTYERWDVSVILEGGISKSLGRGEFTAALRYTQGLTNIIQKTASSLSDLTELQNRDLGIIIGYRIYLY